MGGGKARRRLGKTEVKVFVSYARANKDLTAGFLKRFKQQTDASRRYRYSFWHDGHILAGEKWDEKIQEAITACHLGLLLVSPAFLGSQYITLRELPKFVGRRGKAVVPLMLQPVDFDRHDLKGLKERQIFRLDKDVQKPRAYGECAAGAKRDSFAYELFLHVEKKLDKLFDP